MANRVWKGVYLKVFGRSRQLSLNKHSFYEKSRRQEKKKEKIMSFIVATNVIASRPPERRLTGTPHALAKSHEQSKPRIYNFCNRAVPVYDLFTIYEFCQTALCLVTMNNSSSSYEQVMIRHEQVIFENKTLPSQEKRMKNI